MFLLHQGKRVPFVLDTIGRFTNLTRKTADTAPDVTSIYCAVPKTHLILIHLPDSNSINYRTYTFQGVHLALT